MRYLFNIDVLCFIMATASESRDDCPNSTVDEGGTHVKIEENFLNSGRTGRRNAIPDIYCPQSKVSTAELPVDFAKLSCDGKNYSF